MFATPGETQAPVGHADNSRREGQRIGNTGGLARQVSNFLPFQSSRRTRALLERCVRGLRDSDDFAVAGDAQDRIEGPGCGCITVRPNNDVGGKLRRSRRMTHFRSLKVTHLENRISV